MGLKIKGTHQLLVCWLHKWEDKFIMGFGDNGWGGMGSCHVALDRGQWLVLGTMVFNISIHYILGNYGIAEKLVVYQVLWSMELLRKDKLLISPQPKHYFIKSCWTQLSLLFHVLPVNTILHRVTSNGTLFSLSFILCWCQYLRLDTIIWLDGWWMSEKNFQSSHGLTKLLSQHVPVRAENTM